jgi:PAS domain S-box-containing protein
MESSTPATNNSMQIPGVAMADDIIRVMPVPIIHLDPSFSIAYMNPAALRLVGKKEEEVLGRKCRDIMGSLCNKTDCMAERSLKSGMPVTDEISFNLAGKDHTYKIVAVPSVFREVISVSLSTSRT